MAFRDDYTAGEELPAADMNSSNAHVRALLNMVGTGDGSDGALNVTSGTTQIDCTGHVNGWVIKQYTSFNVSAGATLEFTNVPDSGIVFLVLCQGNYTMAGTVDGDSDGSRGGLINTATRAGNNDGTTLSAGNAASSGVNACAQLRGGQGGTTGTSGNNRNVSGGGSGATPYTDGVSAADVTTSGVTATGGVKGLSLTSTLIAQLLAYHGLTLAPGCGGGSGAICLSLNNITGGSGTYERTSPEGGRGGASICAVIGGTKSNTGTYNLRGSTPSNASGSDGSYTGANAGHNMLAAGPGAGSGGCFLDFTRIGQTVTETATYNLGGGTGGTGTGSSGGSGSGTGTGTHGSGAAGVSGVSGHFVLPA